MKLFLATALGMLAACASDTDISSTTSANGTSAVSTSASSTAGQGGQGAQGQGGQAQGGHGGEGQGGQGMADLVPSLQSMSMWINCQPIVAPDPVHGSYVAFYDNTNGTAPGSVDIVSSTLQLVDGTQMLSWAFGVTPNNPAALVPAGQTLTQTVTKTTATEDQGFPCSYCNGQWTLEVVFAVGSQQFTETLGPEAVSCVY